MKPSATGPAAAADNPRMVQRVEPLSFLRQRHESLVADRVIRAGHLDRDLAAVVVVPRQEDKKIPPAQEPNGAEASDPLGNDDLLGPPRMVEIPAPIPGDRGIGLCRPVAILWYRLRSGLGG